MKYVHVIRLKAEATKLLMQSSNVTGPAKPGTSTQISYTCYKMALFLVTIDDKHILWTSSAFLLIINAAWKFYLECFESYGKYFKFQKLRLIADSGVFNTIYRTCIYSLYTQDEVANWSNMKEFF